ncbi:hypothetical protein N7507_001420 [Penicillium longicatenatum]|nr:hypothetical protein N7507_001420 [Penicillium longicatenatum]
MPAIKREISHLDQDVTNVPETRTSRSGRALKAPTMYEPATAASRKGKRATKKEANITCVKCNRGSSPSNNMIVFCDGCNDTWHQKCHDPTIDDHVVQVADAEWRCHKCKLTQEMAAVPKKGKTPITQKKKVPALPKEKAPIHQNEDAPASRKERASATPNRTAPAASEEPVPAFTMGLLPAPQKGTASAPQKRKSFIHPRTGRAGAPPRFCKGTEYSIDARRAYLSQLAHAELVELAVNLSVENPQVEMFPRDMENYFNANYAYPTQHHSTGAAALKKRRREDSQDPNPAVTNAAKRARTMPPPERPAARPNTRSQSATASFGSGRNHKKVLTSNSIPKTLQDILDKKARDAEFYRTWSGTASTSLSSAMSHKSELSQMILAKIPDHRQYPAAGNGFSLAMQPEDLDILQEDEDCTTFSHAFGAATQGISRIRDMLRNTFHG